MKNALRVRFLGALCAILAVCAPASASAVLLAGGTAVPTDDSALVAGLTQLDFTSNVVAPLSGTFAGTLAAGVFSDTMGNMVFAYQTHNIPGQAASDSITRITGVTFTGFTTSVAFVTGVSLSSFTAGTVNPTSADRNPAGNTVGFDFGTPVPAGSTSAVLLVYTNANGYTRGFASELDGGSFTGAAFSPASVPEPATFALIGAGLAGLGLMRRRRQVA